MPEPSPLHIQSITHEWPEEQKNSLDYVHQRLTLAGAGHESIEECVTRLSGLVKPGGWIGLVEAIFYDKTPKGPALRSFETMMLLMLSLVGVGSAYAVPLKSYLENSRLENVQEKVFDVSYGAVCQDQDIAIKITVCLIAVALRLRDFVKGILSSILIIYREMLMVHRAKN